MRFMFDDLKAAQTAAYFLKLGGGSMPYLKLVKLMYLADRRSLIETGFPITGAYMVSMKYGPVLSEVMDLISFEDEDSVWRQYASPPFGDYMVKLQISDPPNGSLSEYENDLIDGVFRQYRDIDRWGLVDLTHHLPEWSDPGRSCVPIDPRTILKEAGVSDAEIRSMADQAEAVWTFRRLHAS